MRDVNCTFYYSGKNLQSTFRPSYTTDDTEIKCELFEPLDIVNPVIIVDEEHRNDLQSGHVYHHIIDYNYVYIQSPISRYYWITARERRDGLWYITCSEDYLATFKDDILKTEQYVLRCNNSSYWDNDILDTAYVPSATTNVTALEFSDNGTNWIGGTGIADQSQKWSCVIQGNWFALGNATGLGSSAVVPNEFGGLLLPANATLTNILPYLNYRDKDSVKLIDYITDFYFLPFNVHSDGFVTTDKDISYAYYGNAAAAVAADYKLTDPSYGKTWSSVQVGHKVLVDKQAVGIHYGEKFENIFFVDIPRSQIAYENTSTLREMYVQFEPFGLISLDSNIYAKADTLFLKVEVDLLTGDAILYVRHPVNGFVHIATSNVAVRAPIKGTTTNQRQYQLQSDIQLLKYATQLGVAVASAVTGNYLLATTSLGAGLETANEIANRAPMQTYSSVKGTPGSGLIDKVPKLYIYERKLAERDDARFGRPCCKKLKLSKLGNGFVQCKNARFFGSGVGNRASEMEKQAIEQALNGGIYID